MSYVDPKTCPNLPFRPLQPTRSGMFATVSDTGLTGYRRIAPPQKGLWSFQPKYDLYRVIINTGQNGAMFNTLGTMLPESGSGLYKEPLGRLCSMFPNEWIDGFIRVLKAGDTDVSYGQGAILVNDIFLPGIPFWERQGKLGTKIPELGICRQLPTRGLFKVPNFPEHVSLELWAALKEVQTRWSARGVNYYNGMVGKAVCGMYEPSQDGYTCGAWLSYPFTPVLSTVKQPELALAPA